MGLGLKFIPKPKPKARSARHANALRIATIQSQNSLRMVLLLVLRVYVSRMTYINYQLITNNEF